MEPTISGNFTVPVNEEKLDLNSYRTDEKRVVRAIN